MSSSEKLTTSLSKKFSANLVAPIFFSLFDLLFFSNLAFE